jgi:hypothetical protein
MLGRGAEAAADLKAVLTALPGNKQARDELRAVQAELQAPVAPTRTRIAIVEEDSDEEAAAAATVKPAAESLLEGVPAARTRIAIVEESDTDDDEEEEEEEEAVAADDAPARVRVPIEDASGSDESDEEEAPPPDQAVAQQAARLKEAGDAALEAGDYRTAVERYTTSLSLVPAAKLVLCSRSGAFLKVRFFSFRSRAGSPCAPSTATPAPPPSAAGRRKELIHQLMECPRSDIPSWGRAPPLIHNHTPKGGADFGLVSTPSLKYAICRLPLHFFFLSPSAAGRNAAPPHALAHSLTLRVI